MTVVVVVVVYAYVRVYVSARGYIIYGRALPVFVLVFLSLMYLIPFPYILALLTKSVTDFWDTRWQLLRSCSREFWNVVS